MIPHQTVFFYKFDQHEAQTKKTAAGTTGWKLTRPIRSDTKWAEELSFSMRASCAAFEYPQIFERLNTHFLPRLSRHNKQFAEYESQVSRVQIWTDAAN